MILVTPKQEVERKSEWFCGVKFFRSKFKVEWENGVWTKIRFHASGFSFTCGNFTLIFTVFWFFGSDFFLNGFPNPFIVRSWSSFLFSQWKFFELYVRTCPVMFFSSRLFLYIFWAERTRISDSYRDHSVVAQRRAKLWQAQTNFPGFGSALHIAQENQKW